MWNIVLKKDLPRWGYPQGDPLRILNFTGRPVDTCSEEPFIFGKPHLTDDRDEACKDENVIKNLGTIKIEYRRCTAINSRAAVFDKAAPTAVLHEKMKKAAVSHQTSLGASRPATVDPTWIDFEWIDTHPYWTLEFHYLSRDLLELRGHVAVDPKKQPIATITLDNDSDDETREELKAELQRSKNQLARLEGIKAEPRQKKTTKVKLEKGTVEVVVIED